MNTKRFVDVLLCVFGGILFLPFILVIALLVFLLVDREIFFTQLRPGLNAKPFKLFKFRTMNNLTDETGKLLPDEQRMTTFGRLLRATSVDELPELWSVIKGDMSLVGPRPLLLEYLPLYNAQQMRRHDVRPGITGWAQVNGRNAISWEKKFEYDLWYVDNFSFWLDMKILLLTLKNVFLCKNINADGHATSYKFEGSNE